MFSMTEKTLSAAERKRLSEFARYHGSLLRLRCSLMLKMTGIFVGLVFFISCVMLAGFWLLDALPDLQRGLSGGAWSLLFMLAFLLLMSVRDSRYTHEALSERKRFAEAVLRDNREFEAIVEFDETSFALPHEHGVIYFVDDGQGGSVLLDVSTIADDPREPEARQSRISTRWRLSCVAGAVHAARFSGKKLPIRFIDGLNECDEIVFDAIFDALGLSGPQDLARVPLPIQEAEQRVRGLLAPK